jgi:hypothetical protein
VLLTHPILPLILQINQQPSATGSHTARVEGGYGREESGTAAALDCPRVLNPAMR